MVLGSMCCMVVSIQAAFELVKPAVSDVEERYAILCPTNYTLLCRIRLIRWIRGICCYLKRVLVGMSVWEPRCRITVNIREAAAIPLQQPCIKTPSMH